MRVSNLISPKGKPAPNQIVLSTNNTTRFQSYGSVIADINNSGTITLDRTYWDYSATTLKYLKIFLDVTYSKKEIQARIDSGEYRTANLN